MAGRSGPNSIARPSRGRPRTLRFADVQRGLRTLENQPPTFIVVRGGTARPLSTSGCRHDADDGRIERESLNLDGTEARID